MGGALLATESERNDEMQTGSEIGNTSYTLGRTSASQGRFIVSAAGEQSALTLWNEREVEALILQIEHLDKRNPLRS